MGMIMAMSVAVLVTMSLCVVRLVDVHPLYSTYFAERSAAPEESGRYWKV